MKYLSHVLLCHPRDCSLPGSSVHGIFQARVLDWVAISFSRGSSQSFACLFQFSSVQLLSHVQLFATPWTVALQASLSITNSQSLLKEVGFLLMEVMSIASVMPSNHLILCHPLFLLPLIFPSIRIFSSESVLHIRWSKFWSVIFSISPSNEYSGLTSFRMD